MAKSIKMPKLTYSANDFYAFGYRAERIYLRNDTLIALTPTSIKYIRANVPNDFVKIAVLDVKYPEIENEPLLFQEGNRIRFGNKATLCLDECVSPTDMCAMQYANCLITHGSRLPLSCVAYSGQLRDMADAVELDLRHTSPRRMSFEISLIKSITGEIYYMFRDVLNQTTPLTIMPCVELKPALAIWE